MKKALALCCAILFLVAAAGCAAKPASTAVPAAPPAAPTAEPTIQPTEEPTAAPAFPAEITDVLGDTVTVAKAPERIVSLTPSNTEIVFALGLGGKLAGVDVFSDYPEQAKAIARVGDFNGPNLEAIAALKPDLVLAGNKLQKDVVNKLKALGLNVAATEATSYADVYGSIELVGKLTGAGKQAEALVSEMKLKEQAVLDAVSKASRKGVTAYYAMSFGEAGNWTGGPGSFPYEFVEKCGGKNITEGLPVPWVNFSMEELVVKDPDVILFASDAGDVEAFKAAAGYKDLKAVKGGNVFVVDANPCSRPGPRIVEGLRAFAEAITGQAIQFPGE